MSLVVPVSTLAVRVGIESKRREAWAEIGVVIGGLRGEPSWARETGPGRRGVSRDLLEALPSFETLLGGAKDVKGLRAGVWEVMALAEGVAGRPKEVMARGDD